MTLSELVTAVLLKATGKVTSLTSSDTKYQKVLGIANFTFNSGQTQRCRLELALRRRVLHRYRINHKTYELDSEIRKISDSRGDTVQVVKGGQLDEYNVVPADRLRTYDASARYAPKWGTTLCFVQPLARTASGLGHQSSCPFTYTPSLEAANSEVPVDIPEWLVLMCAAEYVRNDITKQNQYPNLIGEANEVMQRMIDDNDAQVADVPIFFSNNGRTW